MIRPNVLVLSPYEELLPVLRQVGDRYTNMNIAYRTGNLEQGVEVVRQYNPAQIDFIISRGGTASRVAQEFSIPVVRIQSSIYDLIRVVQIARSLPGSFAIVGFSNIIANARAALTLLNDPIEAVSIASQAEAEEVIRRLRDRGVTRIVGDVIAVQTAQRLNMEALLISSGRESIEEAFNHTAQLCTQLECLTSRCRMLEAAVNHASCISIVMDRGGRILLDGQGTERALPEKLLTYLRTLSASPRPGSQLRQVNDAVYRIDTWTLADLEDAALFQINAVRETPSVTPMLSRLSIADLAANPSMPVDNLGRMEAVFKQASRLSALALPVVLHVPEGCDELPLLRTLFQHVERQQTLLCYDFARCDAHAFERLLESETSYLHENGQCIAFYNPEKLSDVQLERFSDYAAYSLLHRRNRVVYVTHMRPTPPSAFPLFLSMECASLSMPLLCERPEDLPSLAGIYINMLNTQLGCCVVAVEPEGLRLMAQAQWEGNNRQFIHVLRQLMLATNGGVIRAQAVAAELSDMHVEPSLDRWADLAHMGTLEEIERHVVRTLLNEGTMNRSELATHLGVSRSTLWRILNSDKAERKSDAGEDSKR